MAIQLLITDRDLNILGDPLSGWSNLDVTRVFNSPATGTVQLPAYPEVMELVQPGNRIIVIRDGAIWTAGPLEVPQDYTWSIGDSAEPGPGKVTVAFTDDLAVLAGHLTWVDTTVAWASQPKAKDETAANGAARYSGGAGAILHDVVNQNCGSAAITERQVPHLTVASGSGIGTSVKLTSRYEPLLDACRRVALDGGGLGFRTGLSAGGDGIVFTIYAPSDKTKTARFSAGLGNLRAVSFKQSAPTVTHALVSGTHVEKSTVAPIHAEKREFVQVADTAGAATWWRVEKHVDSSGATKDDTTTPASAVGDITADGLIELQTAGRDELKNGSATGELRTVTIDTEDLKAGRDFDLGDKVTVELPTGLEVVDIVRSIQLQATPEAGELVTSVIGSPDASTDPAMLRVVRELARRLGRVETRR